MQTLSEIYAPLYAAVLANFDVSNESEINVGNRYEFNTAQREAVKNAKIQYCKNQIEFLKPYLVNALPENVQYGLEVGNGFGGFYVRIWWVADKKGWHINSTDCMSFKLTPSWELTDQIYGGIGGRCITRNIDPNDPNERLYACKSEKISFRKPKPIPEKVGEALVRFVGRWIEKKAEIEERGLTR